MKIKTMHMLVLSAIVALSLNGTALANPSMAGKTSNEAELTQAKEKFTGMDKDKNLGVSMEEFMAAYPQMREEAFKAIDVNKDGLIDLDEWSKFRAGHGGDAKPAPAPTLMDDIKANTEKNAAKNNTPQNGNPSIRQMPLLDPHQMDKKPE